MVKIQEVKLKAMLITSTNMSKTIPHMYKPVMDQWSKWVDRMAPRIREWHPGRDRRYRELVMSAGARRSVATRQVKRAMNSVQAVSAFKRVASSVVYQ
jgi:hypothetical protein